MDHFALPKDALYQAYQNKTLHRNFMGYTTSSTDMVIGLGASSISDAKYAYAQTYARLAGRRPQNGWRLTETGHAFIRNICMLFDRKINQKENLASTFSKAI